MTSDYSGAGEEICHRCGNKNIGWYAPSPLWNAVMRGNDINGPEDYEGIVCPICFTEMAESRGIATRWILDAREVNVDLKTTTPSGRVWNSDEHLWEDPPRLAKQEDARVCCRDLAPRSGFVQDGEKWTCPECYRRYVHVCDEDEGCYWTFA